MRTNLPVILTKLKSTHNLLNRDVYTGWLHERPMIGESLWMETREEGRLHTSTIKNIHFNHDGSVEFDTRNSTYKLEYVSDDDEKVYLSPLENDLLGVLTKYEYATKLQMIEQLRALVQKLLTNRA